MKFSQIVHNIDKINYYDVILS